MAKAYYSDGRIVDVEPKNGVDFTIEEVREIISHESNDTVELVNLFGGRKELEFDDLILLCNEDGKMLRLPENINATRIFFSYTGNSQVILGNVLVCSPEQFL